LEEDSPNRSCSFLYGNFPLLSSSLLFLFFLPHKVLHTDSRDFKDQATGEEQGLPRQGGNLWKRGKKQKTLPWDQLNLGCCGKLKEPSRRSGKKLQPMVQVVFSTI
jgi:hypothetical protein